MPVFIQSAESISPQDTFRSGSFLQEAIRPDKDYFTCLHPDYKLFINPGSMRRMSNVIRMGLTASRSCMEKAGLNQPGAIIIGSGLGCVQDTAKFLNQVIHQDEKLLNPTAFIQSTHNTVSGQVALLLGCREYNLTFSQKTLSFESALLDAMMLLDEKEAGSVLVGGIDEIVEESYSLMVLGGCAKARMEADILESKTPGAVPGEGATFFLLSCERRAESLARIEDVEIVNRCEGLDELKVQLSAFLVRNGITEADIDLLVSGRNGDAGSLEMYRGIEEVFGHSVIAAYKHMVGEYDTASAFGTWLASGIIYRNQVPDTILLNGMTREKFSKGLVFNHSGNRDFSFILLSG
ncbi:MAG: beta-ketoacyl synthase chain length factor [Bacteroidota bacterium]